jgi:tRNA(fMet)-specific endonuclease VapC
MKAAPLYLLDTNTVSYILNGRSAEARKTMQQRSAHSEIAISTITEAEVRYGLARKPSATLLRKLVEEFFGSLQVLAWDSAAAAAYADLREQLRRSGRALSALDMLIAAHAISADAVLVSADGAFAKAGPPLRTENWATDL